MDIVHKTAIDREKMQTDRMTNRETKDKKGGRTRKSDRQKSSQTKS